MRYAILPLLVLSGLLLAGCPSDEPDVDVAEAVEPRPDADPQKPMIEQYEIKILDHSKDLKEFSLRRELGAVERMIEEGIGDRRELSKRKSDLEKELKKVK